MFGKLLNKAAGGDPAKAKKANDMAEKLAGVDLDGEETNKKKKKRKERKGS